jgi:sec-independent protein translocase protein TatA
MGDAQIIIPALGFGGGMHWLIILFVALLLFGKRLPEILRGLGGSVREFKKGLEHDEVNPAAPSAPAQTPVKVPEHSDQHK